MHATQNIYLHNIFGTCTKESLNKENTTQIAKYKKHSDLIPWKFVEMSNFFEFLFILKFVTKKLHAQCACRLENLLAQRKKCMHLCKCACVKSSTGLMAHNWQKWKRVSLTWPYHKIYRDEAVGLKSCKYTWKITIFVKMWNLEQYRENLIFCQ